MALVSCVCVQDNNSGAYTGDLMTDVKSYCGSTASADIASALGVFEVYCNAGKGVVTPQGVTASGKDFRGCLVVHLTIYSHSISRHQSWRHRDEAIDRTWCDYYWSRIRFW